MNCKELVYLLGDYFDGSMDEQLRHELDSHIEKCDACMNFLHTYDKTRILCRRIRPEEIPEEFRRRLKEFVVQNAPQYLRRAVEERRRAVAESLAAWRERKASSTFVLLIDSHCTVCAACRSFLDAFGDGRATGEIPVDIVEHMDRIIDALPPGELPVREESATPR